MCIARSSKTVVDLIYSKPGIPPLEPRAIFITLVSKKHGDPNDGWLVPAIGWHFNGTDIMRQNGETDEQLQQRALDRAKADGEQAFMMFRQISDRNKLP